jgi:uncharacterized membrane protein
MANARVWISLGFLLDFRLGKNYGHEKKSFAMQTVTTDLNKETPMSFGIYAVGFAILIGGLMYGAYLMHMPAHWIVVGGIVLLGVGILSGVKATRQKDSSE